MDESGTTQNRRSRRAHLLMTAVLEIAGRAISVKLRNLSPEGAQIELESPPVEGTQLLFRKGDLAVAGRVVWTNGKNAGILFEHVLELDTVLNHVTVPKPRATLEYRRPGLGARAMTEQERKLAQQWIAVPPGPSIND
jgi:PilZ domain